MTDFFDAFDLSPVPPPGPDAVAPEPFRGIYGMPMFVTVPTDDLEASADFWVRGLGFIELFAIPGALVHLRRWAFQDVLLVPGAGPAVPGPSGLRLSFACVLSELDALVTRCNAAVPGSAAEPFDTLWTTRDAEVVTPEGVRVVLTAARVVDPVSDEARRLSDVGMAAPGRTGDHVHHDR